MASGYASTDESANSDALSNPVLPDESHSVTATLLRTKALPLPQSPQTTLQPVSAPAAFGHSSTWTLKLVRQADTSKRTRRISKQIRQAKSGNSISRTWPSCLILTLILFYESVVPSRFLGSSKGVLSCHPSRAREDISTSNNSFLLKYFWVTTFTQLFSFSWSIFYPSFIMNPSLMSSTALRPSPPSFFAAL